MHDRRRRRGGWDGGAGPRNIATYLANRYNYCFIFQGTETDEKVAQE